jgi:hypothetical protein
MTSTASLLGLAINTARAIRFGLHRIRQTISARPSPLTHVGEARHRNHHP